MEAKNRPKKTKRTQLWITLSVRSHLQKRSLIFWGFRRH
jgi:hypothetical protein